VDCSITGQGVGKNVLCLLVVTGQVPVRYEADFNVTGQVAVRYVADCSVTEQFAVRYVSDFSVTG